MRKSLALLAVGLSVALTLYACHRPDGVPAEVKSEFTLLNGRVWSWSDHTSLGSVVWRADHHGLSFWIKAEPDESPDPRENPGPDLSYDDDRGIRISSLATSPGAGRPCEIVLTSAQIAKAEGILREALRYTSHPIRTRMLERAITDTHRLSQARLVTDVGGGCVAPK